MSKLSLDNVGSLVDTTTAVVTINSNSAAIESAVNNTLSLDGTQPNSMQANLDMNSNRVLNLPAPVNSSEPLRLIDLTSFPSNSTIIPPGGTAGQVLVKKSSTNYDVEWATVYNIYV